MAERIERHSALAEVYRTGNIGLVDEEGPGLFLAERHPLSMVQIACWSDTVEAALKTVTEVFGAPPDRTPNTAVMGSGSTALWVGPERWLLVEPEARDLFLALRSALPVETAAVTDQSHARVCLSLSGPRMRDVLAKGSTIDFHPARFTPGTVIGTQFAHVSAYLHCVRDDQMDVYVARSFGEYFYEWIMEAAAQYGITVSPARI